MSSGAALPAPPHQAVRKRHHHGADHGHPHNAPPQPHAPPTHSDLLPTFSDDDAHVRSLSGRPATLHAALAGSERPASGEGGGGGWEEREGGAAVGQPVVGAVRVAFAVSSVSVVVATRGRLSLCRRSRRRHRRCPREVRGAGRRRPNRLAPQSSSSHQQSRPVRGQARKKRRESAGREEELLTPPDDSVDDLRARLRSLQAEVERLRKAPTATPAPASPLPSIAERQRVVEDLLTGLDALRDELDTAPFISATHYDFYGLENSGPSSASDSDSEESSEDDEDDEEDEEEEGGGMVDALKKFIIGGGAGGGRSNRGRHGDERKDGEGDEDDEDGDDDNKAQHERRQKRSSHEERRRRRRSPEKRPESSRTPPKRSPSAGSEGSADGRGGSGSDGSHEQHRSPAHSKEAHPVALVDGGVEERSTRREGSAEHEGDAESGQRSGSQDGSRAGSDFAIASSPASSASASSESSSRSSYSSSQSTSSTHSVTDRFPYERNLLALQPFYVILRRLYACRDAVTYRAVALASGAVVVLKVADSYTGKKDPKEVRLLTAVQGHPRIVRLVGWHPLLSTECSAMVTEYVRNASVEETVMRSRRKAQLYMRDLLTALQHIHGRNVLYRDVKPSNVLWNDDEERATVIDFDVATFFDGRRKHRSVVGTDGYMSTEILRIQTDKKLKRDERKRREAEAEEAEEDDDEDDEEEKSEGDEHEDDDDAKEGSETATADGGSGLDASQVSGGRELSSSPEHSGSDDVPALGYGFPTDVYSAGVVLAQLIFGVHEDDVADLDNADTKGPAFVRRCRARMHEVVLGQRREKERPELELCCRMLDDDDSTRIGVDDALQHAFFSVTWTKEEDDEAERERLAEQQQVKGEHAEDDEGSESEGSAADGDDDADEEHSEVGKSQTRASKAESDAKESEPPSGASDNGHAEDEDEDESDDDEEDEEEDEVKAAPPTSSRFRRAFRGNRGGGRGVARGARGPPPRGRIRR